MDSLFAQPQKKPLADRMRPTRLSDFVGQETAVGERSPLRRMIEKDQLQSVLFYGPPGTGKTTLAQVIAHMTGDEFVAINAVSSGVPELRKLIAKAQELQRGGMGRTIVFIDEIHRFNKAQQDVLLPYVENGTIILIGATTENPFFEINSPLLSRMKVIRLEHLTADGIKKILERALTDKEKGYGSEGITVTAEALEALADSVVMRGWLLICWNRLNLCCRTAVRKLRWMYCAAWQVMLCSAMIKKVIIITISFRLLLKVCAAVMPTLLCTIWPVCWKVERT